MKVIAKMSDDKVLMEVGIEDLVRMLGHDSAYQTPIDRRKEYTTVGFECSYTEAYDAMKFFRSADQKRLQVIQTELDKAKELVARVQREVEKTLLFDTIQRAGEENV
jgi:hypothetical protein